MIDNIKLYSWKSNKICGINEIEAVGAGGIVTYSTFYDQKHMGYQLDRNNFGAHAWCPLYGKTVGEWIQVSAGDIKLWNSVIVQGRGDYINSATSFKLSYSIDGFEWFEYEDGKIYSLPADRNIKTRFNIDPVYATVLRLTFMSYSGTHVCVRFGATYFVNS